MTTFFVIEMGVGMRVGVPVEVRDDPFSSDLSLCFRGFTVDVT